jgi:hypothetical protein
LAKSRLTALFADIGFAAGGKKRGFCRLPHPQTTFANPIR